MNKFIALLLVAITLPACVIEPGVRVRYREVPTTTTVYVEAEPQQDVVVYSGCHSDDRDYVYSLAHCPHGVFEFEQCSRTYIRPYCMTQSEIEWDFYRCEITDVCETW